MAEAAGKIKTMTYTKHTGQPTVKEGKRERKCFMLASGWGASPPVLGWGGEDASVWLHN